MIHRDIKPANMMLTANGTVKLMDFGIAKAPADRRLTMTGTTMGSLYYMSPEQIKGEPTDARSDLYSVGVSLYEIMTGKKPFDGDSQFAIMAAHLKMPVPPIALDPKLPAALNDVILMAIAKEPGTTLPDRRRVSQCAEFCAGHPPGDTGDHDRGAGSDYGEHANAVGCEFADGVWGQPQRPRFRAGCGAPGGQDALRYACSSPAASPAERSSRPLHDAGSIDCARRAGRGWNLHAPQLQDLCEVARRGNSYT